MTHGFWLCICIPLKQKTELLYFLLLINVQLGQWENPLCIIQHPTSHKLDLSSEVLQFAIYVVSLSKGKNNSWDQNYGIYSSLFITSLLNSMVYFKGNAFKQNKIAIFKTGNHSNISFSLF